MSPLRSVEEQLAVVLARVTPVAVDEVPLHEARGRTLRAPVRAAVDIPVFDNSAMDGFAVRYDDVAAASADASTRLTVVADLPAGTPLDPPLAAGEAARIMTGSPVPTAADAIVPFEDTAAGLADSLGVIEVVRAPRQRGAHIRRQGDDVVVGDELLPAGVLLGPLQLSAAAAAGVAMVTVARAPRVAVVSTGSELVPPGTPLVHGQIPESNSELLAGLALAAGAVVTRQATVDDEGTGLTALLDELTTGADPVDAVVLSGGVSAGAYEVVKNSLAATMEFTTVAMQPGKPQGFGATPGGVLLFGLPGNPVSAAVSFEVFVRPALLAMQGRADLHRAVLRLPAGATWRTPPGRRQYLPAVIDRTDPARWTVAPATAGGSGSHLAGGLARAEAWAVIAAEVEAVAVGDLVDVMLMS
ncbi:molybdopterin molybdotransferase MoeA [Microbacterium terricola]|uniref:Molybdopterin molybdenumtransferase n=1 Tax=Microbacterium terricola TaxID=344163 RepID=A0ABM8E0K7_9MICO|nr:gephyrin-like molybdotransferase Glp [Microbacterium terricola]UYK40783.1 molybdopterin molybdotransferase MoeA [Microbacterium terricola]BDV31474.1 molybdopterin molybdenumtransferase MoeA [Microbacterium terricola]